MHIWEIEYGPQHGAQDVCCKYFARGNSENEARRLVIDYAEKTPFHSGGQYEIKSCRYITDANELDEAIRWLNDSECDVIMTRYSFQH